MSPTKLVSPSNNLHDEYDEVFEKEVEWLSRPMWLTNQFVDRPWAILAVAGVFFVLVIALTFGFELIAMNAPTDRDYLVWDSEMTYKLD